MTTAPPHRPGAIETRIIAIANQKGGVGKTTTTMNLAGSLAGHGYRVLVVDGDPQGNLTDGFKVSLLDDEEGPTQVAAMVDGIDPHGLVAKPFDRLHVLPASLDMYLLARRLRDVAAGEQRMKRMLDHFRGEYDYILLDLRPAIDDDTDAAMVAASGVFVPVDVDRWSMKAVGLLLGQIERVLKAVDLPEDHLEMLGIIINAVVKPMGHYDKAVYQALQKHPRIPYLGDIPIRSADLKEARHHGQPVAFYRPRTDTNTFYRSLLVNAGLLEAETV